ncbi:MAG: DegV family protein [Bacillota bacterium]
MKIQLVVDSAADLPQSFVEENQIEVVPLNVQFGDETFADGTQLSTGQFYEKMAESEHLPVTSLPSPQAFADAFQKVKDKGPILCITISAATSGTYQSALVAKEMFDHPIEVIDSLRISMGAGLQVMKAQELINQGLTLEEVKREVLKNRNNYHTFIAIYDLKNVIKGGRISNWKGNLAQFLNIKPILNLFPDGTINIVANIRGRKKQLEKVLELIRNTKKDLSKVPFVILHAQAPKEELDALIREIKARFNPKDIILGELGPIMGSHGGFRSIGVAF